MKIHKKSPGTYQQRLDDFAKEYYATFSWLHWRHPSGELRHKLRVLGSGLSLMGDWQETKALAVENIFLKIKAEENR